jgi:hypothetical protein
MAKQKILKGRRVYLGRAVLNKKILFQLHIESGLLHIEVLKDFTFFAVAQCPL